MTVGAKSRLAVTLTLVTILGAALTGVGLAQEGEDDEQTGDVVFTIGSTGDLTTLNPLKVYQAIEYYPLAWTYHLPMSFAVEDLGPVDDFVTDVEVSEDATTFTYTVREDVVWSDGTPMTAEDLAFTLNLYKESHAYIFSAYLTDMASAEATDATHVVVETSQPTGLFATNYLYTYVLPQHVWSDLDGRPKEFENVPNVGSGPFLIEEYRAGEFLRMVRNPRWSEPEPNIDEIVWRYFQSEDALAESLKAGEIDFAYLTAPNIFNSLEGEQNIETLSGLIPAFDEIALNTGSAIYEAEEGFTPHGDGHPALADVRVRQAIRMAVDSERLVEAVYLGLAAPGDTVVPPVSLPGAKWTPQGDDLLAFDIDAANAALDEAGYLDCDDDGVREMPDCEQPSLRFRYFTRTSDQTTIETAPFVQDWLEQIGIETEITAVSSGRLGDIINAGEFDMFDWGWIPDIDPDSVLGYFKCDQRPPDGEAYGNNDSYYCNPEYDRLYEEQHSELDQARRLEIIHEMQRIFYLDAAYIVKWYSPTLQAWRTDTFTGYLPQPAEPQGDALAGYSRDGALSIRPVAESAGGQPPGGGSDTRGASSGVWIGIVAGVIALILAIVLIRRRRTPDEDVA